MARKPTHPDRAAHVRAVLVDEDDVPVSSGGGGPGGDVVVTESALPDGAATEETLASINAKLPAPSGGAVPVVVGNFPTTQAVSAAALPLPDGAATDAALASLSAKTPTLGAASISASSPAVLANKFTFAGTQYAAGAAILNLDLLTGSVNGWLDVSTYNSAILSITSGAGVSAGVIQFEETNDTSIVPGGTLCLGYNSATQNTNPLSSVTLAANQTASIAFPLRAKFFRCRVSTAVAGGTVQAAITLSQLSFRHATTAVTQATAASLNATIAAIPAGTNAIGDTGTQYRNTATGAASSVSVISPATPTAATIKAAAGRVIGWQFQNSAATLRSVKVFGVAAPTLGTTAALFEIDIPAGGAVFMNFPGGLAFGTAATYSVTSAKGLTDNTSATLALGDVSGAFFFA